MPVVYEGAFRLHKIPMAPYDNNAYILADPGTGEAYIVDTPAEPDKLLAEAKGLRIKAIFITHNHRDHLEGLRAVQQATGAPVGAHPADGGRLPVPPSLALEHGATFSLGEVAIQTLHTPGHTPGSLCFLVGKRLLSGDTLFPGGPGRTTSPEEFRQIVASVVQHLLPLPEDVMVHPGHGADTTIARARHEYQVFASQTHPADLYGDVVWLKS